MKRQHGQKGSALIATIGVLATVVSAVALSYSYTNQTSRLADRGQDGTKVRVAAEGALEYAYAMWRGKSGQMGRPLTTAECSSGWTVPTYDGVVFDQALTVSAADQYGTPVANPVVVRIDVAGFPGWKGRSYYYVATVGARGTSTLGNTAVRYRAKRVFEYVTVNLFETMFYFEGDFETYKPAAMLVSGLTHTNRKSMSSQNLSGGQTINFASPVSSVLGWTNDEPYRITTWSSYAANSNQPATLSGGVSTTSRLEALGTKPASVLDAPPTTPLSPSGQLIGPDGDSDGNPNNDSYRELIEPPVAASPDPAPLATRRLYNKAGIVITVNGTTKTVTTGNGTTLTAAQTTAITSAITTTTMYDARELKNVRVSSINVGSVVPTLNAATGFNGVLYIHDTTTTTTATPKNAIRLTNGGTLPNVGLTVASQNGVYIQGDYNTGATTTNASTAVPSNSGGNPSNTDAPTVSGYTRKPAAVIGDAVMLLSNSWKDTNASLAIGSRVASHTTYNTAMIGGFMPSGYQPGGTAAQYGYSGGANNYARFLEDWNGKYCTYFGSMVQLFVSNNFTGKWDTGNIFSPPNRCWNFDTNFNTNPPPGSVEAVFMARGRWSRM